MKNCGYFTLIVLFIIYASCDNKLDKILNNQEWILDMCVNKELARDETRNYLCLRTNNGLNNNEYYFNIHYNDNKRIVSLCRDTIEFSPDNIIEFEHKVNISYETALCFYMENLLNKLDSLNIQGFNGICDKGYTDIGTKAILFLNNGDIIENKPQISHIKELDNYKEIGDSWYLYAPSYRVTAVH